MNSTTTHCKCFPCWFEIRRMYDWDPAPTLECICCLCKMRKEEKRRIKENDDKLTLQLYLEAERKAMEKK